MTDAAEQIAVVGNVEHKQVGGFAGFERAGDVRETQGTGGVVRGGDDGFGGFHAVSGGEIEQVLGIHGGDSAGVEAGRECDGDARVEFRPDGGTGPGFVMDRRILEGGTEGKDVDRAEVSQSTQAVTRRERGREEGDRAGGQREVQQFPGLAPCASEANGVTEGGGGDGHFAKLGRRETVRLEEQLDNGGEFAFPHGVQPFCREIVDERPGGVLDARGEDGSDAKGPGLERLVGAEVFGVGGVGADGEDSGANPVARGGCGRGEEAVFGEDAEAGGRGVLRAVETGGARVKQHGVGIEERRHDEAAGGIDLSRAAGLREVFHAAGRAHLLDDAVAKQ